MYRVHGSLASVRPCCRQLQVAELCTTATAAAARCCTSCLLPVSGSEIKANDKRVNLSERPDIGTRITPYGFRRAQDPTSSTSFPLARKSSWNGKTSHNGVSSKHKPSGKPVLREPTEGVAELEDDGYDLLQNVLHCVSKPMHCYF